MLKPKFFSPPQRNIEITSYSKYLPTPKGKIAKKVYQMVFINFPLTK